MISSRLQGGLGNQLFQISAAYALALRNDDVSGFNFNTCYTPLQGKPSTHYTDTILSSVNGIGDYGFKHVYHEPKHSYSEIPYNEDLLIEGYFQSERYFSDFKEEIVDLFNISDDYSDIVKSVFDFNRPTTSVHVRRGDYLINPNIHPTCDLDYYKKAMDMFPDNDFIFISDDIKWVKENFVGENIKYSPFNDEIVDLKLMTMCDNNIIANSTFSWWGAYLNKNKNKIIVAPKNWFGPNGPSEQFDIVPEEWIKI
jgi:hypothetical protein